MFSVFLGLLFFNSYINATDDFVLLLGNILYNFDFFFVKKIVFLKKRNVLGLLATFILDYFIKRIVLCFFMAIKRGLLSYLMALSKYSQVIFQNFS